MAPWWLLWVGGGGLQRGQQQQQPQGEVGQCPQRLCPNLLCWPFLRKVLAAVCVCMGGGGVTRGEGPDTPVPLSFLRSPGLSHLVSEWVKAWLSGQRFSKLCLPTSHVHILA